MVVNFAAESHVDRSITDPEAFVQDQCDGNHHPVGRLPHLRHQALPSGVHR